MKRIVLGILALLACQLGSADYTGEFGVEYVMGNLDVSGIPGYTPPAGDESEFPSLTSNAEFDGWGLSGELFLGGVDDSGSPLQLAPFLSRASSIGGHYSQLEVDGSNAETHYWDIFGRLVIDSGWVFEVLYGNSELDTFSTDEDLYRLSVGYYVAQNSQVRFGFDARDQGSVDQTRWSVDVMHVQQLGNGMTWTANLDVGLVQGDAALGRDDDGHDIDVAFSWYFNEKLGIGVHYFTMDRDVSGETNLFDVWANYFVTEKISLELSYFEQENQDNSVESDGVQLEAKYRF